MNCRDFLTEFEERNDALSQPAQLHLDDCPDCVKTSGEQKRVWQMIDGLRRVDAPRNFDFRVKARIAKSKPADFQTRFFPALRYVLPLGLVALVLGLLAFNTTYFSGGDSPQIAEKIQPAINQKENSSINSFPSDQVIATGTNVETSAPELANANVEANSNNQEKQIAAKSVKTRTNVAKKNFDDEGGGSRDHTLTAPPSPKFPLGINPNQTVETSPNAGNPNLITDVQVLEIIGIEIVSENGGKRVKAVKPGSLAESSDVKKGDVIEAIDGKRIGDKPVLMETFESKKLIVVRDAKKIEIVLQNKSN